jgi:hypothetical protein
MGVRSSQAPNAPAFATDALRPEVVGNTGLHLTLVDLPGLISVSEDPNDSIDAETQAIIQRARHFDKEGLRTIGIITKPDLINKGTEERVARLAKNWSESSCTMGSFSW